jgi:hypothetical protein
VGNITILCVRASWLPVETFTNFISGIGEGDERTAAHVHVDYERERVYRSPPIAVEGATKLRNNERPADHCLECCCGSDVGNGTVASG